MTLQLIQTEQEDRNIIINSERIRRKLHQLYEENDRLFDKIECGICFERKNETLFATLPCCKIKNKYCWDCLSNCSNCPICRLPEWWNQ